MRHGPQTGKRTRALAILTAALLCLSVPALPALAETPPRGDIVRFGDPVVEEVIRKMLRKETGDITQADMEKVTIFEYDAFRDTASKKGAIRDISALALCENLKFIRIAEQDITSIEALRDLPLLEEVWLQDCKGITDLSPLAGKPGLTRVHLSGLSDEIDLSPVLSLPNLKTFNGGWYKKDARVDISALSGTENLEHFSLGGVAADFSPLARHTGMRSVTLRGVDSETFATLIAAWPGLSHLNILQSPITSDDLALLSSHAINRLYIQQCPGISDLSALAAQVALETLHVTECSVTDVSPLKDLPALRDLNLWGNDIFDLSPLKGLLALRSISLSQSDAFSEADVKALLPGVFVEIALSLDAETAEPAN